MAKPNPEVSLNWDRMLAWRQTRQFLDRPLTDPVQVTSGVGGIQTQVASSALQALAIRSEKMPDIDRLLWQERTLVKTWAMRGTLHLLPASELGDWIGLLRRRPWKITPAWERYHGMTGKKLDAITDAIAEILSDEPMSREELAEAVVNKTKDRTLREALASGWGQVLKPAANRGLLAHGPPRGRNVTFVDPAAWLGRKIHEPDPVAATAVTLARFLDANGPATLTDFSRWLGVDPKTGRELMAPHLDELVEVETEGHVGWLTPEGVKEAAKAEPADGTYLLPGFDPYTLAPLSHRDHIIPEGKVDEVSRAAGWIAPVILDKGRIVGTWEVDRSGILAVTPFGKLTKKASTALKGHVRERYHGLLGEPEIVVVGP
jgi:hypothetical protein